MDEWAKVFNQLVEAVKKRFEETDKNILGLHKNVVDAITLRDHAISQLQHVVVQLRKEVADLQSSGIEKVLLEESKEVGKS